MALTFHHSNRLEYLFLILCKLIEKPLDDVFVPEEILISAEGMRRYLDRQFAYQQGICANVRYSKVPSFFWRIMGICLPKVPQNHVYSPLLLRWYLLDIFNRFRLNEGDLSSLSKVRSALQSYLNGYETAAYDLAEKIAAIFDQYLVYRPKWIEAWDKGVACNLGADEAWQMCLWRYVRGHIDTPHRVALWQELSVALSKNKPPKSSVLPKRVFVFGLSTLSPMYLDLLNALSNHVDVHLLLLNPSEEYWGDIASEQQLARQNSFDENRVGHPLLASLGMQGRYFFNSLNQLNPLMNQSVFDERGDNLCLLHRIQADIQSLTFSFFRNDSLAHLAQDKSIVLHCAHSPLRELQVAKEAILAFLEEHADKKLEDVVILSPNIDVYLPFIEAVFGSSQEGLPALPYSVADTKTAHNNPFLNAWANLLLLFSSRFECDWVLGLLDNYCVQQRFSLSEDDVALCRHWVKDLSIHWGLGASMREEFGGKDDDFTWEKGICRLLCGVLLPENNGLWQEIAPLQTSLDLLELAGRFASFLGSLFDAYDLWQLSANVDEWAQRIVLISENLLHDEKAQLMWVRQVEEWQAECHTTGCLKELPASWVSAHLQSWLNQPSERGFLRGGITFCSMMPMRNLPFSYLALLGMNDGAFPRMSRHLPFDLMAHNPEPGDRARRDDDRYLFLELLMSARDVLHLSFVGKDIQDNNALEPSGLLHELVDVCARMYSLSSDEFWQKKCIEHPLHVFSRSYFQSSGSLKTSYRTDYARAYRENTLQSIDLLKDLPQSKASVVNAIEMSNWLDFWRNPVRYWLKNHLLWNSPFRDEDISPSEPFELENTHDVYHAFIQARIRNTSYDAVSNQLKAENCYPSGQLGELTKEMVLKHINFIDASYFGDNREPFSVKLNIDQIEFSGSLNHLLADKQVFFETQKNNAANKISYYLQHLVACAALPEALNSYIITPSEQKIETLTAIECAEAKKLLSLWLNWFIKGQKEVLPFFPRLALKAFEYWDKSYPADQQEKAEKEVRKAYFPSSGHTTAQADYREVKTVYQYAEKAPIDEPLFWQLLDELIVPLLACGQDK